MQRQIRIGLVIAFCWGLRGAVAEAQQFSSAETKPSPTPTPIPLSEIASHAESTTRFVQSIETTLSKDRVTAIVEKSLPPLTSEIELRGAEMAKFLAGVVPPELLHSMEIVLQRYDDQLSSWNNDLTERAKILDGQIAQLDRLSKIWKSTLRLPQLSKTAPEIPERVQGLIDLIGRTEQAAGSLRERALTLQGHVLEAKVRLQAVAPAFEQAQADAVKNFFVQACVIRTTDGSEVIVPNGTIISNKVTNWTLSDRYRAIEVPVTVARSVAPHHVIEVLKRVAVNHPGVTKEPAPQAHVVNFASATVSFNLRAWTERYEDWVQVRSDLSLAVDEALTAENITVA